MGGGSCPVLADLVSDFFGGQRDALIRADEKGTSSKLGCSLSV